MSLARWSIYNIADQNTSIAFKASKVTDLIKSIEFACGLNLSESSLNCSIPPQTAMAGVYDCNAKEYITVTTPASFCPDSPPRPHSQTTDCIIDEMVKYAQPNGGACVFDDIKIVMGFFLALSLLCVSVGLGVYLIKRHREQSDEQIPLQPKI